MSDVVTAKQAKFKIHGYTSVEAKAKGQKPLKVYFRDEDTARELHDSPSFGLSELHEKRRGRWVEFSTSIKN